ncbi:hypothetical protein [Hydrogenophaga intermedia]|uniref:hypothetical protein n=1 Tax=Hydrogenophaga intermedia TaxID=65786 RepID=UPI0012DFBF72|nr:hypothetical protein [Hydrogenophaga intermedia]
MKPSAITKILYEDDIPFGVHLGWGTFSEHEHGVARLASFIGLQRQSGILQACDRSLSKLKLFEASRNEELVSFIVWTAEATETRSLQSSRSREQFLEDLEQGVCEANYVSEVPSCWSVWSQWGFVVCVRNERDRAALAMLAASFRVEDLALTYTEPTFEPASRRSLIESLGPGLGLYAPGLARNDWVKAIARHQLLFPPDEERP